jgi:hypothetical protein
MHDISRNGRWDQQPRLADQFKQYDSKTKRRGESIETYKGINNNSIQNDINKNSVLT